jgi:carboxylesterase
MTGGADIVYTVHGSNAHAWWRMLVNRGYPWWRRWSLFCCELRRAFAQACEVREFRWSGGNTHQARMDAGAQLAREIVGLGSDRRIHLVGHSHGGNVALAAVNQLPPHRVDSVIALANPNMALLESQGLPKKWLYWGSAVERVQRIWSLYSPQDLVQCRLAGMFHGISKTPRRCVKVIPVFEQVRNGEVRWEERLSAHRAMHSGAMGAVAGALLRGSGFEEALESAGLSSRAANRVRDRGNWPGIARADVMMRSLADPSPFDLGNAAAETALLFIHGFTASPAELRPMAACIANATGWRCKGPLLPGHGTRVEDLQKTSAEDWITVVEQAYEELSRDCRRVFLVGLSMGAVIACHVAMRRAGDRKLCGLILMAPSFGVTARRALGVRVLGPIGYLRRKNKRAADYFLDNRQYTYLQTPVDKAADVVRIGRDAMRRMTKLQHLPVLMFVGDRESTVSLKKMLAVARDNPWIRLVRLPRSRHILPSEPDSEMLFEESIRFVKECLGGF